MTDSFMPECLARYNLVPSLADPAGSIKALHKLAWELDSQIKLAQTASVPATDKVIPEYDKVAGKDEKAKATASKLISGILASIEKAVTANPNVAYWLAEMDKAITQFHTSEVTFHRWEADKAAGVKSVASNEKVLALKADRRDVVTFTKKLTSLLPAVVGELPAEMVQKNKAGLTVVKLPNIQGRGSGTDTDSPAGKFASLSFMVWKVGDESFPVGTDSRIILRSIFTGADRIGKRPGDLYDAMLTANGGKTPNEAGQTVKFTLGGKEIVGTRTNLSDEDTDEDTDEESGESEES